jgi:hypothetical protein
MFAPSGNISIVNNYFDKIMTHYHIKKKEHQIFKLQLKILANLRFGVEHWYLAVKSQQLMILVCSKIR